VCTNRWIAGEGHVAAEVKSDHAKVIALASTVAVLVAVSALFAALWCRLGRHLRQQQQQQQVVVLTVSPAVAV
jgi:hypothetical protein